MDRQDFLKIGVSPLIDNKSEDGYFYEIIVFTGNRVNAGTDSKVIKCLFASFYLSFFLYFSHRKRCVSIYLVTKLKPELEF